MSPAVTGTRPRAWMCSTAFSTSSASVSVSVLRLPMIWCTSSTTPGIVWCSCTTPSMRNAPDRRAAKRRQQHATHRIAERVPEAALERLQAELGDVRVVLALGRFDQLRTDQVHGDRSWKPWCCDVSGHSGRRAVTHRNRSAPPPTRGRLVKGLGPRPTALRRTTAVRRFHGLISFRPATDGPCVPRSAVRTVRPSNRFTSNRARRPAAPAPRSECSCGRASRARGR